MKHGFAMLTEERRRDGIFADLSVYFNMTIANLNPYMKHGFLSDKSIQKAVNKEIDKLHVKTPGGKTKIGTLSGGNQQKVIFGKWLLTDPEILLLDEPTRGIDVGAKYEIYQIMNDLVAEGKSIIMVSSEMPELLGVCDRILVMSNGRQAGLFESSEADQVTLMEASAKYVSAGGVK
jgi:methyl-galactoside transport system ATP-binding protein